MASLAAGTDKVDLRLAVEGPLCSLAASGVYTRHLEIMDDFGSLPDR